MIKWLFFRTAYDGAAVWNISVDGFDSHAVLDVYGTKDTDLNRTLKQTLNHVFNIRYEERIT